MTTVYFVRHAEPSYEIGKYGNSDRDFPLTEKGRRDSEKVTEYLRGKNIGAVLSSPFTRAVETVTPFADSAGLPVTTIEGFKERKISDSWVDDFTDFHTRQWADFTYRLADGENLAETLERNIAALEKVLAEYDGKNIVIGTHGTALSLIINKFDSSFGHEGFKAIAGKMPWVVKMVFDGQECKSIEHIDMEKFSGGGVL